MHWWQLYGANIFIWIIQFSSVPVLNSLHLRMWLTRELLEYFITINSDSLYLTSWVYSGFAFGASISAKATSQLKEKTDVCLVPSHEEIQSTLLYGQMTFIILPIYKTWSEEKNSNHFRLLYFYNWWNLYFSGQIYQNVKFIFVFFTGRVKFFQGK